MIFLIKEAFFNKRVVNYSINHEKGILRVNLLLLCDLKLSV